MYSECCTKIKRYGIAEGRPNETSVYRAADDAFNYIYKRYPKKIIVMGLSIGTGPACYIAEKYSANVKGLYLFAPLSSIKDMAAEYHQLGRYFVADR
jgi:esterase/lipase